MAVILDSEITKMPSGCNHYTHLIRKLHGIETPKMQRKDCYQTLQGLTTVPLDYSETSAGHRSNRPPLLIGVTFCYKSSMNISIDNHYCNRSIHIRRPIFPVNNNGASVFTIQTTFGIAHVRVGVTLVVHRSPKSAT